MAIKFVLRYKTEQQKKKLEKIADQCGRSANSHILHLIDRDIAWDKSKRVLSQEEKMPISIKPKK